MSFDEEQCISIEFGIMELGNLEIGLFVPVRYLRIDGVASGPASSSHIGSFGAISMSCA